MQFKWFLLHWQARFEPISTLRLYSLLRLEITEEPVLSVFFLYFSGESFLVVRKSGFFFVVNFFSGSDLIPIVLYAPWIFGARKSFVCFFFTSTGLPQEIWKSQMPVRSRPPFSTRIGSIVVKQRDFAGKGLAGGEGFELSQSDSESDVLPLEDPPTRVTVL